jgi:photosystem II stability/assembly factor-like uncharacterized protein
MTLRNFFLSIVFLPALSYAQNFWIPLDGPADPSILPSPQPLYARYNKMLFAYTGDSIYSSLDNGNSWQKISNQLKGVNTVVETPTKKLLACGAENKVLSSIDAGVTWEIVPQISGQFVGNLFVSPKGYLFATIMMGGVWRSTDDGITWQPKTSGLPNQHWGEGVAFLSNGDMLMSTGLSGEYGIYRSTNDGDSWTPSHEGLTHTYTWWLCESKPGIVFAGTLNKGIYRSSDNGTTWHSSSTGVSDSTKSEVFHIFADGDGIVYADCSYDAGLYRSTDDGLTWQSIQSGLKYKSPGMLAIDDDGYMYYGGRDLVYRSAEKVTPPVAEVKTIAEVQAQLFPNPADTYVIIEGTIENAAYYLYDQLGRVIGTFASEGTTAKISIEHLLSGSYTLKTVGAAPARFIKK